jgi:hypothetical protein
MKNKIYILNDDSIEEVDNLQTNENGDIFITSEEIIDFISNEISKEFFNSDDNSSNDKTTDNSKSSDNNKKIDLKLRYSSRLKKIFKILKKNKLTSEIASKFLDNYMSMNVVFSYLDYVDDNNGVLSGLYINKIPRLKKYKGKKEGTYTLKAYKNDQRQNMKIGKVINKLWPGEFSKKEIEIFVNEFKSEHDILNGNIGIELVDGQDLLFWYDQINYSNFLGGTLRNSCMRNVGYNRLALYVDNPEVVKLAVLIKNNKLMARALVWETNDGTYMDRVYYTQDHIENAFYNFAEKNGWKYYKKNRSSRMSVKLKHFKKEYFSNHPYFDTFRLCNNGRLKSY